MQCRLKVWKATMLLCPAQGKIGGYLPNLGNLGWKVNNPFGKLWTMRLSGPFIPLGI